MQFASRVQSNFIIVRSNPRFDLSPEIYKQLTHLSTAEIQPSMLKDHTSLRVGGIPHNSVITMYENKLALDKTIRSV